MKKTTFLVMMITLASAFFVANAQTADLDSLESLLQQNREADTVRIHLLIETAYAMYNYDLEKVKQYATEADSLSEITDYPEGKVQSLSLLGTFYYYQGDYAQALDCYQKSLQISEALGDKAAMAENYNNIGRVFFAQSDYPQTLMYYQKALAVNEALGDTSEMAVNYHNIGRLFYYQDNYSEALEHYRESLQIFEKLGDEARLSINYGSIGDVYYVQGNYPKALEYYHESLRISEKSGNRRQLANAYNNIGGVYYAQADYAQALEYYQEFLKISEELGDKVSIANGYNNIGLIYEFQGKYNMALDNYRKSLQIVDGLDDQRRAAKGYLNVGSVHYARNDYDAALEYLQEALTISIEVGSKKTEGYTYIALATMFLEQNQNRQAYQYSQKAYQLAKNIGNAELTKEATGILAKSASELGLYQQAYNYHVEFKAMSDSLYNEENIKKITGLEYEYKYEKEKELAEIEQQKAEAVLKAETRRQKTIRNAFIVGFILATMLIVIVLIGFFEKRKANNKLTKQKQIIEQTNEELQATLEVINRQKDEITEQHKIVSEQKEHITNSINYASRIQKAVLPAETVLKELLPQHFILFRPRDIVSGDFYWVQKVNNQILVAVADCTGHGVPGAFMSMLGVSFLNEIVTQKEITKASKVLEELRTKVKNTLRQTGKTDEAKDGMDMAFYVIDSSTKKLQFSGANNPLYIVRNNELIQYKANRQPIGIYIKEKPFVNHEIQLQKDDMLYTFSDGFIDQFGGEEGRKFMTKNFKRLLLENSRKPMSEQEQILNQTFVNWMGNEHQQIDDVVVAGVRI